MVLSVGRMRRGGSIFIQLRAAPDHPPGDHCPGVARSWRGLHARASRRRVRDRRHSGAGFPVRVATRHGGSARMGEELDEPFFVFHLSPLPNPQGLAEFPRTERDAPLQATGGTELQALLKPPKDDHRRLCQDGCPPCPGGSISLGKISLTKRIRESTFSPNSHEGKPTGFHP